MTLEDSVKKGIKASGYPLEMEIGGYLKGLNWHVRHSPFYFDLEDFTHKEYDLHAAHYGNNFDTILHIECKHSNNKQWVFFAPDDIGFIMIQDLRFFPIKPGAYRFPYPPVYLKDTIFKPLSWFSDGSRISLNNAVFQGEKREKSRDINNSILTSIKALISDNLSTYNKIPNIPQLIRPRLSLSLVVFEGNMFICIPVGATRFHLEKTEYVKYRHEMRFDIWNHEASGPKLPIIKNIHNYENDIGENCIVEIIHKNLFPQYMKELIKGIEEIDKLPTRTFIEGTRTWFNTEYLISS